jgi:divalent metal cation (Fe/Co/Zn/Cd) transporter
VGIESLGLGAAVMVVSATANYFVSRNLLIVAIKTDSVALVRKPLSMHKAFD